MNLILLLLICITGSLIILTNKKNSLTFCILFSLFILFFIFICAFRDIYQTPDTEVYINYYNTLKVNTVKNFFTVDGSYGLGYEFLNKICKVIAYNNYQFFFAMVVLLNFIIVCVFTNKQFKYKWHAIVVFMGYIAFFYNFIVLRQGIALSLIFVGFSYISTKRLYTVLCIFLAFFFHETAIICIILLPIIFMKKPRSKKFFYVLMGIVLILYATQFFTRIMVIISPEIFKLKWIPESITRFLLYYDGDKLTSSLKEKFPLFNLVYILLIYLAIYFRKKKQNLLYDKLLFISILGLLVLGFLPIEPGIMNRVLAYFSCTMPILIYLIDIKQLSKNLICFGLFMLGIFTSIMQLLDFDINTLQSLFKTVDFILFYYFLHILLFIVIIYQILTKRSKQIKDAKRKITNNVRMNVSVGDSDKK